MKKRCQDRMKFLVLYFLCKVLKAKVKADGAVDPFLLKVVDDLSACETFPWGRYTFNDNIDGIWSVMSKLNGFVKPDAQPFFPGFIIPLEILAFDYIPCLGRKFRQVVPVDKKVAKDAQAQVHQRFDERFYVGDHKLHAWKYQGDEVDDGIGYIDIVVDSWRERLIEQR